MRQPGDFIGRFRVERLLGEGGIAEIYQVRHRQLGTVHTLKLLTLHHPWQRERLLQEGRTQAQIQHPNLVAVTDVVEAQGQVGLVMEYVQGFSLADCLQEGGGMPLEDSLDLFQQILEAVGTAHAAGVLHRDLRPQNILLTTTGDRVVAKVADFGFARLASGARQPGAPLVETTTGTPGYMSPEQITDTATVDRRADIFALGVILYELLSGQRAFVGDNQLEILNHTASGVYTPLQVHLPDIPHAVADAIDRALEISPGDRFPDSETFAEALALPFALPVSAGSLPPSPSLPGTTAAIALMPEADDEDDEDPPTDDTETGLLRPPSAPDWGLEDASVSIDESIPKPDFEGVKRKIAEERARLARLDAERERQRESGEGDDETPNVQGFGSKMDSWLVSMLWPMVRAFGTTVKFILGPGIGLAVLTLWAGRHGAELLEQARGELEMAATQVIASLDKEMDMANQVQELGGRPNMLEPFRRRYENATTDEERIAAARMLNNALLEELRLLPHTDDPEQALARRNLELQLNELTRKHDAYEVAVTHLEDESATPFAQVALTFDMAERDSE